MKVSVVMSVYNNENTLLEAIESVLNQDFKDFEFIIINDGSLDKSGELIAGYANKDKRIIFVDQDNQGLAQSLNKGIELAKGDYVARQDADDVSLPQRLRHQVEFLENNKNIGFSGCSCKTIDESHRLLDCMYISNNPEKIMRALGKNNIFCHGSMIFRLELLRKVGGYRTFFKCSQDYDLYLRLVENSLPGSINKLFYCKRERLEGISLQRIKLQAVYARLARNCYELRKSGKGDQGLLNENILNEYMKESLVYDHVLPFMKALFLVRTNEPKEARKILVPFVSPFKRCKWKCYLLWIFTYLPRCFRNAIFKIKGLFRKRKLIIKISKI